MRKHLFLTVLCFFVGCGDSSNNETQTSFDESFNASFKKNFVKSCIESSGGDEYRDLCACVADDVLANFSKIDLLDGEKVSDYAQNVSAPKCGYDG